MDFTSLVKKLNELNHPDQVRGNEKAKPKKNKHPFQNRLVGEGDVIPFKPKKTEQEKYKSALEKQTKNRSDLHHAPCEYCGNYDCNFDCDESQAGGFNSSTVEEGYKFLSTVNERDLGEDLVSKMKKEMNDYLKTNNKKTPKPFSKKTERSIKPKTKPKFKSITSKEDPLFDSKQKNTIPLNIKNWGDKEWKDVLELISGFLEFNNNYSPKAVGRAASLAVMERGDNNYGFEQFDQAVSITIEMYYKYGNNNPRPATVTIEEFTDKGKILQRAIVWSKQGKMLDVVEGPKEEIEEWIEEEGYDELPIERRTRTNEAKSALQKLKDFDKLQVQLGKKPIFTDKEKEPKEPKKIKEDETKRSRRKMAYLSLFKSLSIESLRKMYKDLKNKSLMPDVLKMITQELDSRGIFTEKKR